MGHCVLLQAATTPTVMATLAGRIAPSITGLT
jgi:hypothetical protein